MVESEQFKIGFTSMPLRRNKVLRAYQESTFTILHLQIGNRNDLHDFASISRIPSKQNSATLIRIVQLAVLSYGINPRRLKLQFHLLSELLAHACASHTGSER